MSAELWIALVLKLIDLFKEIDWSKPADAEVSKEIKAAKNIDELHAAMTKMRGKVT